VIAAKLVKEDFDKWIPKIRETLQQPSSPVSLRNGVWGVIQWKELWQAVGQGLFDSHLDTFKESVVAVLTERDPQFELPPEERYAASIHGKVLKHSQCLRKGLAESLALLGSFPTVLSNCSRDKPQTIALLSVRDIFKNSDWVLWGSLNNLLPLLAEASPKDADEIRNGFATAILNSRGVHSVDPSGKPELELSAKYGKQAEEAENAGYQRLAVTMRGLADFYAREAKRIIEEHGNEGASDS